AGEARGFDRIAALGESWADMGCRFTQLGLAAALEAAADAGLDPDAGDASHAGVVMANAHGDTTRVGPATMSMIAEGRGAEADGATNLEWIIEYFRREAQGRPVEPDAARRLFYDHPATIIGSRFGATGPRLCVSTACASGVKSVERAVRWLRRGHAPIAFAGGCESIIDPVGIWMLNAMRALTTQCD